MISKEFLYGGKNQIINKGATKPSQLEINLLASAYTIPKEIIDEIEKILDYTSFIRKIG